jgi:hypothetical protein
VEVETTTNFPAFQAESPQQVWEENPVLSGDLPRELEEHGDPHFSREIHLTKGHRGEELPRHPF